MIKINQSLQTSLTVAGPLQHRFYDQDFNEVTADVSVTENDAGNGIFEFVYEIPNSFDGFVRIWNAGDDTATADPIASLPLNGSANNPESEFTDGSVPVDHNYGGGDTKRITRGGVGVNGCTITFYIRTSYLAGLRTPINRGQSGTVGGIAGRWISPVNVNPNTYTVVVYDPAVNQSWAFDLTVTAP